MRIDKQVREAVDRLELPFNALGIDPYGISKTDLRLWSTAVAVVLPLVLLGPRRAASSTSRRAGRAMLVGNHSGGIAIDAAMVVMSCLLEMDPPRLAQGMAEKFINRLPFMSAWASRTGHLTGLPEHAERLLEDDRLLLVFPEGARGTAKLFKDRNSLVDFGSGFVRLALKTKTPIVPVAVLGGGEAFPTVANAYKLGRAFGLPYVPIVAYGLPVPLPAKIEIEYAPAMRFTGHGQRRRRIVHGYVDKVKEVIATMIDAGARRRRGEPPLPDRGGPVRILIPGAAGAIARKVALRLKEDGHEVVGIDRRPWPDAPIEFHEVDVRKRAAEDVFRKVRPQAVVHMATVTSLVVPGRGALPDQPRRHARRVRVRARIRRRALHLRRTAHVLRRGPGLAAVPRGGRAAPRAQPFPGARRSGRRRPLRRHRALAIAGAGDDACCASATRWDRAVTGRSPASSAASAYPWSWVSTRCSSSSTRTTSCERSCSRSPSGRGACSTSRARSHCPCHGSSERLAASPFPLPEFVLSGMLGRFGLPQLPSGAVTHLKYPVVVDGHAFRQQTGFAHEHDEIETIRSYRDAVPLPL